VPLGGPSTASPLDIDPTEFSAATEDAVEGTNEGAAWPHTTWPNDDSPWHQPAIQRQHGTPQGVPATRAPYAQPENDKGFWSDEEDLQTYDRQSNTYDPQGFTNNVPNNRISQRRTWGHSNPENNPTWYGYSENPVQAHLAISAADMTSYDNAAVGGWQFANGDTPDLWIPEGSSVAYETPAPPATTTSASVPQAASDPAAGWA
jgi:hypothetical protein